MALKNGIFTLALSALLMGSTAMAQEAQSHGASTEPQAAPPPGQETQAQGFQGGRNPSYRWDRERDERERRRHSPGRVDGHVHTGNCHHAPQPPPPQYQQGRYELKLVQKWKPGYYQEVWVPEDCKHKQRRHGHVTKCRGGYYEQQWVPGSYQAVEEWVWVSSPGRRPTGPEWGSAGGRWN